MLLDQWLLNQFNFLHLVVLLLLTGRLFDGVVMFGLIHFNIIDEVCGCLLGLSGIVCLFILVRHKLIQCKVLRLLLLRRFLLFLLLIFTGFLCCVLLLIILLVDNNLIIFFLNPCWGVATFRLFGDVFFFGILNDLVLGGDLQVQGLAFTPQTRGLGRTRAHTLVIALLGTPNLLTIESAFFSSTHFTLHILCLVCLCLLLLLQFLLQVSIVVWTFNYGC